jgi:hypothetical protein
VEVVLAVVAGGGDVEDALLTEGGDSASGRARTSRTVPAARQVEADRAVDDVDTLPREGGEGRHEVHVGLDADQEQRGVRDRVMDDLGHGGAVRRVPEATAAAEVGLDAGWQLGAELQVVATEADVDDGDLGARPHPAGGLPGRRTHLRHALGQRVGPRQVRLAHQDHAGGLGDDAESRRRDVGLDEVPHLTGDGAADVGDCPSGRVDVGRLDDDGHQVRPGSRSRVGHGRARTGGRPGEVVLQRRHQPFVLIGGSRRQVDLRYGISGRCGGGGGGRNGDDQRPEQEGGDDRPPQSPQADDRRHGPLPGMVVPRRTVLAAPED